MHRPDLVVIDTETTGLDPARQRIIDIAAVRLGPDLQPADSFTCLVNPEQPLPLMVERLTGISAADLAGAPRFGDVHADLARFLRGAVVIGHNIAFDLDFLTAEAKRAGLHPLAPRSFDTLEAALLLYPELDRHALDIVAAALDLPRPTHRALPDALTTAALFRLLCARAAELGTQERRLLTLTNWAALDLLDAQRRVPPESPPPVRPAQPPAEPPPALPCDPAAWREQFEAPHGLAARLPGFRPRPGKLELAEACMNIRQRGGIGLFEAGTGMGKSLAYLLPAAFAAAASGQRVVISTKTKVLQRQLAAHDLPLAAAALPEGWRWTILMGRENYLCQRALDEAVQAANERLPDRERALALAYLLGRARRGEVDLSALPYRATLVLPALRELAHDLRSTSASCLRHRCPARARCHWRLARARAQAAHLVCVNHALLLTPGAVPAYEHAVIDEAHLLPGEALSAFSRTADTATLERLRWDIRGRRRQRSLPARLRGAAAQLPPEDQAACNAMADRLEQAAALLPDEVAALAAALTELAAADAEGDAEAGYAHSVWLRPALRELPAWDQFATACSLLADALYAVASAAAGVADLLPEEHREAPQVRALAGEAGALADLLGSLPDLDDPSLVCWGEVAADGRWSLTAAPFSSAAQIRDMLWERLASAVLTSATLTVSGSFAYFREQAGLSRDLEVHEHTFSSPFDFRSQAVLVLEHDAAAPAQRGDLPARQARRLRELTELTGGRLLALFTNRREMEHVAHAVGRHVEQDGVVLLAQGVHGSAAALAEEFRSHPATVLLGVDSLWTGQDFPGDVLLCLVIAKLPFPRQDALFRARKQACEQEGRPWFPSFYLPEAILRFRQGFGRLIRTETDRGVIVVLDQRLSRMSYGQDFLSSLPKVAVVRAAPHELAGTVGAQLDRLLGDPPRQARKTSADLS